MHHHQGQVRLRLRTLSSGSNRAVRVASSKAHAFAVTKALTKLTRQTSGIATVQIVARTSALGPGKIEPFTGRGSIRFWAIIAPPVTESGTSFQRNEA